MKTPLVADGMIIIRSDSEQMTVINISMLRGLTAIEYLLPKNIATEDNILRAVSAASTIAAIELLSRGSEAESLTAACHTCIAGAVKSPPKAQTP